MQNVVTVSHTVWGAHVEGPKKCLARWYTVPLGYVAWLNTGNTHDLHLSYHAKLGRCRSNRMGVSRFQKLLGRWVPALLGWGVFHSQKHVTCLTLQVLRADNGSVGHWSWVKWVNKYGWVTGQYP